MVEANMLKATADKNLVRSRGALWWTLLIASCGTLVGNPEEEDSTSSQIRYRSESQSLDPIQTSDGEAIVLADKGLSILLTDAPVDGAKAVYITVQGVSVKEASGSWTDIPMKEEKELNLLNLQDGDAVLLAALETLPAGSYQEIRLELSDSTPARIILADDSEHELTVPSGEESGLKIKYDFEVSEDKGSVLVLDFDLRRSIHTTGGSDSSTGSDKKSGSDSEETSSTHVSSNEKDSQRVADSRRTEEAASDKKSTDLKYILKPVLRAVEVTKSGAIVGKADDGAIACAYPAEATADDDSDCSNAVSSAKSHDGSFRFPYLPEGEYNIRVFGSDGKAKDYSKVKGENGAKVEIVEE
jgi:hypothetical protein